MRDTIKRLEEFLSLKHIVVFNVFLLLVIKLVIPLSGAQFAAISELASPFDSRSVIAETNKAREAEHLPALKANSELDLAAQEKLNDMIKNSYFAHVSPAGVSPWYWISDAGYHYVYAGENLAIGYSTAPETVQAWLNSPGHRANLLNTHYEDIGVAVANANINGVNGVLVVQTFGNQLVAPIQPKVDTTVSKAIPPKPAPAKSLVSGAESQPPQAISTDQAVRLVNPTESIKTTSPERFGFINNLSKSYTAYLIIMMGMLMIFGIIRGFKRNSLVSIGVSFALLILTVSIPIIQSVTRLAIF